MCLPDICEINYSDPVSSIAQVNVLVLVCSVLVCVVY